MKIALILLLLILMMACTIEAPEAGEPFDAFPPTIAIQGLLQAEVLHVINGTTIEVEIGGQRHRIRYIGVEVPGDSPSLQEQALHFNRFLVEGHTVELERDAIENDSLGNLLGYVYADGELVNKALITNGYAAVADSPPSFLYKGAFLAAEENARQNLRGLWGPVSALNEPQTPILENTAAVPSFGGGTLPTLPTAGGESRPCDFSGSEDAVIKGVLDSEGQPIYLLPSNPRYSTAEVDESQGGRWFCIEFEAIAAGWRKSD